MHISQLTTKGKVTAEDIVRANLDTDEYHTHIVNAARVLFLRGDGNFEYVSHYASGNTRWYDPRKDDQFTLQPQPSIVETAPRAKAANLTAKLPDGKTATRKTHREYTHVVAAKTAAGKWWAFRWSQGRANAEKGATEARKWIADPELCSSICEVRIVEVADPRKGKVNG
jgi:hypothetical protein